MEQQPLPLDTHNGASLPMSICEGVTRCALLPTVNLPVSLNACWRRTLVRLGISSSHSSTERATIKSDAVRIVECATLIRRSE